MAGPGGREVGRLTVRVAPDTSDFSGDLRSTLNRIERGSRVAVTVVPDFREFTSRLRTRLSNIRARLPVRVEPDLRDFAGELRTRLATGGATLPVRLDISAAEITRIRAQLAGIRPVPTIPVRADIDVDRNALGSLAGNLASAGAAGGGILKLAGSLAKLSAVAGSIPSLASLGASLASMAPAAGVAVPAILAAASAGVALKVGMSGVSEALSGDADALEKLAPPAREFVKATKDLAPAWEKVQQSVQGALFKDLGATLSRTATNILPVLKDGLTGSASALNLMGQQVLNTASGLAESGALGQALKGANTGLRDMAGIPATIVQGLVQIGAAAAPAFNKLTASLASGVDSVSQKLAQGFASGGLQEGIETALGVVQQFFGILGDLGATLGNIFGPAAAAGAGFLPILAEIAALARQVTASPEAQATFQALFETLAAVGQVVSGVLGAALQALLPILSTIVGALAGPLQSALALLGPIIAELVTSLGSALGPVVGVLANGLAQLLPIVSLLIAQLASALGPVLVQVGGLIAQIAGTVLATLGPALEMLPAILAPILDTFSLLAPILIQIAQQLLTALSPALVVISGLLKTLLVALSPLIEAVGMLLVQAIQALMPIINALMPIITALANLLAGILASAIKNVVIPAIELIVALLTGDFKGALDAAKRLLAGIVQFFIDSFTKIVGFVGDAIGKILGFFGGLVSKGWAKVKEFGRKIAIAAGLALIKLNDKVKSGIDTAIRWVKGLPDKAKRALGDLGGKLRDAGRSLISGFVNGIKDSVSDVKNTLGDLTSKLTSWKGPETLDARILTPAGELVLGGFIDGLVSRVPEIKRLLGGVTGDIPTMLGSATVAQEMSAEFAGIQPGDRIVLSPDGRREFDAYIDRLADERMAERLGNPARLGRR